MLLETGSFHKVQRNFNCSITTTKINLFSFEKYFLNLKLFGQFYMSMKMYSCVLNICIFSLVEALCYHFANSNCPLFLFIPTFCYF